MPKLTLPTTSGKGVTLDLERVEPLADMPITWVRGVHSGAVDYACAKVRLQFSNSIPRNVYKDDAGLFVRGGGKRNRLPEWLVDQIGGVEFWTVADVPPKAARRKRDTTRKMPNVIMLTDVVDVMQWPLGNVKTNMAAGEGWTDCIVALDDMIRLGGKHNTRRVRYDGRFYITHNGRRVYFADCVQLWVLDVAGHVYGVDRDSDVEHNKVLKGY